MFIPEKVFPYSTYNDFNESGNINNDSMNVRQLNKSLRRINKSSTFISKIKTVIKENPDLRRVNYLPKIKRNVVELAKVGTNALNRIWYRN